jgi:hypothetical protein
MRAIYATGTIAAMRFESKRDLWVVLLVRALPFVILAVLAAVEYAHGKPMRGVIAGLVTLVIVEVFMVEPMMRSTYYLIEGDMLFVRSGFLKWRVPVGQIRSITPTRSARSSPALSLDRLLIEYDDKHIMVSPEAKQRFIEALRTINPAIAA